MCRDCSRLDMEDFAFESLESFLEVWSCSTYPVAVMDDSIDSLSSTSNRQSHRIHQGVDRDTGSAEAPSRKAIAPIHTIFCMVLIAPSCFIKPRSRWQRACSRPFITAKVAGAKKPNRQVQLTGNALTFSRICL